MSTYRGGGQNVKRPNVEDQYFGISKFRILKERKMSYSIFLFSNLFFYFDICLNNSKIQNIYVLNIRIYNL